MCYKIIFWVPVLLLIVCTLDVRGQGGAISPSRIFFSGNAGQTFNQQVEISNPGTKPLLFIVSVKDWERDSLGNKLYYEAGTLATSNARWIEVTPRSIEIPPGSKESVMVTMHVPTDEKAPARVTNSMIFFTQVAEQLPVQQSSKGSGVGINIQLEFGIHVYYTPAGFSKKELDFVAFKQPLGKGTDSTKNVTLKIKNSGEVVTDAYLRFEMTNKMTGEELVIDPFSISMMPLTEQVVKLNLPLGLKGKFLLVAILDNGAGTNLKVAEKEIAYE